MVAVAAVAAVATAVTTPTTTTTHSHRQLRGLKHVVVLDAQWHSVRRRALAANAPTRRAAGRANGCARQSPRPDARQAAPVGGGAVVGRCTDAPRRSYSTVFWRYQELGRHCLVPRGGGGGADGALSARRDAGDDRSDLLLLSVRARTARARPRDGAARAASWRRRATAPTTDSTTICCTFTGSSTT